MKNKKIYIGISIVTVLVICIVASIFYIKANNKDVKYADFSKDISNEDTKEAMEISEEKDEAKEITDDETKSEEVEKKQEEKQTEVKEEEKKEIIVTNMNKKLYVKASSLNVRSGPDTTYSKLGVLSNSAEVSVTGKVKGVSWYRISYNGKVGYVDSRYLSETKPEPKVEVEQSSEQSTEISGRLYIT